MLRVQLFGLPALLEAVLRQALAGEPSLAVEAVASLRRGALTGPSEPVVVVTREDALAEVCPRELMAECPHAYFLVLTTDGRIATLHQRDRPPTRFHDVSMDGIARALRTLANTVD